MASLFRQALAYYVRPGIKFDLFGWAKQFDVKSTRMGLMDLLSAPDLAAGAVASFATALSRGTEMQTKSSNTVARIIEWLGASHIVGLKKIELVIQRSPEGGYAVGEIDIPRQTVEPRHHKFETAFVSR